MRVEIVDFPATKVAAVEHQGSSASKHQSIQRLIDWRKANQLSPSPRHKNYALHYNDPHTFAPDTYRVDICLSVEDDIDDNPYGVINKYISACRCARARYTGPRDNVLAAQYLYDQWLPDSGERYSGQPVIFHFVNVGPDIKASEMITDVYLPLATAEIV